MPTWMDKPQAKDFDKAQKIVSKEKGKSKKKFKDRDFGLAMHIWKNIEKSKGKPQGKKPKKKKADQLHELLSFATFLDRQGFFTYADSIDAVVAELANSSNEGEQDVE